jgi:hypothetical protein
VVSVKNNDQSQSQGSHIYSTTRSPTSSPKGSHAGSLLVLLGVLLLILLEVLHVIQTKIDWSLMILSSTCIGCFSSMCIGSSTSPSIRTYSLFSIGFVNYYKYSGIEWSIYFGQFSHCTLSYS